jgi:hypothetical protein
MRATTGTEVTRCATTARAASILGPIGIRRGLSVSECVRSVFGGLQTETQMEPVPPLEPHAPQKARNEPVLTPRH